ncbi:hypothetical protein BD414DRAFT_493684 [Trametes punicea]|nr:hypothetical protein BD414DRAFT_493684 [Trametes punicea]
MLIGGRAVLTMSHSAFFYGTLLHPSILRRVIGHEGSQLKVCPAVLLDHTRHKICNADYPAVLPYNTSRALLLNAGQSDLAPEERTVRGTFVSGLSDKDIALLDLFEGDEYVRESVAVHPLGPLVPLSSTPVPRTAAPTPSEEVTGLYVVPPMAPELPPLETLPPPLPAQTYIYAGPLSNVSPELWSYDDFVRENAWKWVGGGQRDEYYVEVDRRREMDGKTLQTAMPVVVVGRRTDAIGDHRTVVAQVME